MDRLLHHFGDQDERLPFAQLQVTGEWREYRTLPWGHNHVFAARGAVGLSAGDTMRYGSFRLGGSWGESAYYTLPDEVRSLRGFPFCSAYGDGFFLGSLEYRLPIWRIDRGVSTIPFFARYLSAAAFMDIGNAFDSFEEIGTAAQQSLIGVGAEIKGTAIMGWGFHSKVDWAMPSLCMAMAGIPSGSFMAALTYDWAQASKFTPLWLENPMLLPLFTWMSLSSAAPLPPATAIRSGVCGANRCFGLQTQHRRRPTGSGTLSHSAETIQTSANDSPTSASSWAFALLRIVKGGNLSC